MYAAAEMDIHWHTGGEAKGEDHMWFQRSHDNLSSFIYLLV